MCRLFSFWLSLPLLFLRRRVKSVADVLKGIRQNGFSQGR